MSYLGKAKTDLVHHAPLNITVYGKGGAGKTEFALQASTIPEMSPVYLLAFEPRDTTMAKFPKVAQLHLRAEVKSHVDVWPAWKAWLQEFNDSLIQKQFQYRTLIVDGVSRQRSYCIDHILKQESTRDRAHDPEVLELDDRSRVSYRMTNAIVELRSLCIDNGINLIVTARERERSVESIDFTGDAITTDLEPGIHSQLMYEFDGVYRLRLEYVQVPTQPGKPPIRKQQRVLYTLPKPGLEVKDKLGIGNLTNPTLLAVWKKVVTQNGYTPLVGEEIVLESSDKALKEVKVD